jgi:hypothetical protein
MGGLVTVLKVREQLKSYEEDPGWYKHAPGTVALKATDEELRRDGIQVTKLSSPNGGVLPKPSRSNEHHQH